MDNLSTLLKAHKLSESDYAQIVSILGREPNLVELGVFSAMWSEHCSYKSSKPYLRGFPSEAQWVLQGPGENAGVIDIGGGYAAVFKIESHNHPSFIEPYAGAATGVGGILRDIFTMGARPVALLNSIRFGELARTDSVGKLHKYLLGGVVKGIGDYGNCMGVPTVGGEFDTQACYNGNILVNAFALGIAKADAIFKAKAEGVGNSIIYVGSKTGRDGLGGAVMSSDSFSADSASLRPTVQLGDPFTQKRLLEACLELFAQDVIVGIQDMGAAGLTSSSFEMAGRSKSGMRLYLDKVPMRESAMSPYELMLSESQERMLICAKKGCEAQVQAIFDKWELPCAVIGEVCEGDSMELFWNGAICAKLPIAPLIDPPILARPTKARAPQTENVSFPSHFAIRDVFETLFASLQITSKAWIYEQFDSTVQTNTILHTQGDSSIIRVKENGALLALSIGSMPHLCFLSPREGARRAVAKCGLEIAVRGARPLALTDCLNFGSPDNPEVMWEFAEVCEGIKEAASALQTPVVSGNVSLHNRSDEVEIFPTPTLAMVGILHDAAPTPSALQQCGNLLFLAGQQTLEYAGSLAQRLIEGRNSGALVPIDLAQAKALWQFLQESRPFVASAKEVGEGGVAIAAAKMAVWGELGARLTLPSPAHFFAHSAALAILEICPENVPQLQECARKHAIPLQQIGDVAGDSFALNDASWNLQWLKDTFARGVARG